MLPSRPSAAAIMRLALKSDERLPGALEVAEHRVAERLGVSALAGCCSRFSARGPGETRFTSSRGFATLSSRSMMPVEQREHGDVDADADGERQHDDDGEHRP